MFPNANNNSDTLTVFLMGRVGNASSTTLRNYISKHPGANRKIIARRVAYLVKEMHLRGVSHGNLHDNNIIVSFDSAGRITGMWAIDFGRSRSIPLGKTETKMYRAINPNLNFHTKSLYGKTTQVPVYNGSRSNINMLRAITTAKMASDSMKRIAKLRKEIVEEMKQYRSPKKTTSPRRTKSLSLRRSATPARPRSAPARIATPQKGLKVRFSLKRRRA